MEFRADKPIYLQIADLIQNRIINGTYPLGEKLPSVRELALELIINVRTVQAALRELDKHNVIETVRGRGTYVTKDQELIDQLKQDRLYHDTEQYIQELLNITSSDRLKQIFLEILAQTGK